MAKMKTAAEVEEGDMGTMENMEARADASSDEVPKVQEVTGPKRAEVPYLAGELAENAEKLFGTKSECILAAFKAAGLDAATVEQAKELVKEFLNKKIR